MFVSCPVFKDYKDIMESSNLVNQEIHVSHVSKKLVVHGASHSQEIMHLAASVPVLLFEQLNLDIFIDRISLAKQGDNGIGSVYPSVCVHSHA